MSTHKHNSERSIRRFLSWPKTKTSPAPTTYGGIHEEREYYHCAKYGTHWNPSTKKARRHKYENPLSCKRPRKRTHAVIESPNLYNIKYGCPCLTRWHAHTFTYKNPHAILCPDSSKCAASGAASVSPLDHGDIRPLTNVAEHELVMLTMNHHDFTSSHSVWSDNVSRGRQRWWVLGDPVGWQPNGKID